MPTKAISLARCGNDGGSIGVESLGSIAIVLFQHKGWVGAPAWESWSGRWGQPQLVGFLVTSKQRGILHVEIVVCRLKFLRLRSHHARIAHLRSTWYVSHHVWCLVTEGVSALKNTEEGSVVTTKQSYHRRVSIYL